MASSSWEPRPQSSHLCRCLHVATLRLRLALSSVWVSWCFYKDTSVWVRSDSGDLILTCCICKGLISE